MLESTAIYAQATVPEHSVHFMQAVSQGEAFVENGYLCYAAQDWLTIIGYPLATAQNPAPPYTHQSFLQAKSQAVSRTGATQCYAIAPDFPPELQQYIEEKDVFYTLSAQAPIPTALRAPVRKAQEKLRIEVGSAFTPEHRRLWTEFLAKSGQNTHAPMSAMVRRLFLATPAVLQAPQTHLRLLNAYDHQGHLCATLLVDFAPKEFCAYLLGAHSRTFYTPHAADALFAHMLHMARQEKKTFLHLGLGVHEGISRFKRKWGALPSLPFLRAAWQEKPQHTNIKGDMQKLFLTALGSAQYTQNTSPTHDLRMLMGQSKRQIFAAMPEQRPYAMLWQVQKGNKISWIGGSAHFFCYSFERSFRALFEHVDTVLFEGPLDAQSLHVVEAEGKRLTPEQQPLLPLLNEAEICALERMVRGPEGFWPRLLNMQARRRVDVRWYLAHTRPWTALFTLWTGYLERKGWQQSVDLEAWHLAHDMQKNVVGMESLEEQLASLNAVPAERVVRYFQNCQRWPKMIRKNVQAYLNGDLLRLMGTSAEFPTRTHTIINKRDERFRQRMRPFLEQGRAAVFVGTAHMLQLRTMLKEDGFTLQQVQPTWRHKMRARLAAKETSNAP